MVQLVLLLPLWLAVTAIASPTPKSQDTQDRSDDNEISRRDLSSLADGIVAGVTAGATFLVGDRALKEVSREKVSKWWSGEGGKGYRRLRGQWTEWDERECSRRKKAELLKATGQYFPTVKTLQRWNEICASRETAEADERNPYIGEPQYHDEFGNRIRDPVPGVDAIGAERDRQQQQFGHESYPDANQASFKQQLLDNIGDKFTNMRPSPGVKAPLLKPGLRPGA